MRDMIRMLTALLLLGTAMPGAAADRGDKKTAPAASSDTGDLEAAHREMIAFGKWVLEVEQGLTPALTAVREMGPHWQAAMRSKTPPEMEAVFAPVIVRTEKAIVASRARLTGMTLPSFPLLKLPPDVQPARLHADMLRMLDQLDEAVGTFRPVIQAFGNGDPKAAELALVRMLGSVRTLMQAQATMTGAWIATTEADDPARQALLFDQHFYHTGIRVLLTADRLLRRQKDPTLAADLTRLADQMDESIEKGLALVDARQVETEATATATEGRDGASAKAVLHKVAAMNGLYRESFAVSRAYAVTVRAAAKKVALDGATLPAVQPLIDGLRATRTQLDAVSVRQVEIMAGTR